jgi:pSer/pThr/pTyr-binding forkhead associated (FHA) protein
MMRRAGTGADTVVGLRQLGTRRAFDFGERWRAYLIGSGADADIRVADPHVSALHCALARQRDGEVVVLDRGSRNGTYIDGVRIERARLRPGARLTLGTLTLVAYGPGERDRLTPREVVRLQRTGRLVSTGGLLSRLARRLGVSG